MNQNLRDLTAIIRIRRKFIGMIQGFRLGLLIEWWIFEYNSLFMNNIHIYIHSNGISIQSYSFINDGNSFKWMISSHELFVNNGTFFLKKKLLFRPISIYIFSKNTLGGAKKSLMNVLKSRIFTNNQFFLNKKDTV